ncbi:MAG TPA: BON domain-containing protein [Kofleriaceae bacterium]|jgi:osmotically-inducible protein OsmY
MANHDYRDFPPPYENYYDRGFGESERSYHGPHVGKGPKGAARSDERIKELVHDQLTDHAHVDATDIEVAVQDGEVTLTGTVEDLNQKRMAEDSVFQLRGIRDVHNQLRIQRPQRFPEKPRGSA